MRFHISSLDGGGKISEYEKKKKTGFGEKKVYGFLLKSHVDQEVREKNDLSS